MIMECVNTCNATTVITCLLTTDIHFVIHISNLTGSSDFVKYFSDHPRLQIRASVSIFIRITNNSANNLLTLLKNMGLVAIFESLGKLTFRYSRDSCGIDESPYKEKDGFKNGD